MIRDTFLNKTGNDVGIPFFTEFFVSASVYRKHYFGGVEGLPGLLFGSTGYGYGNTTAFVSLSAGGLGVVLEDDVFRAQGGAAIPPQPFNGFWLPQIYNSYFGLGAGQSYTMEWSIYLLASGNYFDFINAVRSDQRASARIDNHIFLFDPHPNNWLSMDVRERRSFFQRANLSLCSTQFDQKSSFPDRAPFGPDIWEDPAAAQLVFTHNVFANVDETGLGIRKLLYFNPFLSSQNTASQFYPDSRIVSLNGSHLTFDKPWLYGFPLHRTPGAENCASSCPGFGGSFLR